MFGDEVQLEDGVRRPMCARKHYDATGAEDICLLRDLAPSGHATRLCQKGEKKRS